MKNAQYLMICIITGFVIGMGSNIASIQRNLDLIVSHMHLEERQ